MNAFLVKAEDWSGDDYTKGFDTKEAAWKHVDGELDKVQQNFRDEGREYRTIQNRLGYRIYVHDKDIYLVWKIYDMRPYSSQ